MAWPGQVGRGSLGTLELGQGQRACIGVPYRLTHQFKACSAPVWVWCGSGGIQVVSLLQVQVVGEIRPDGAFDQMLFKARARTPRGRSPVYAHSATSYSFLATTTLLRG